MILKAIERARTYLQLLLTAPWPAILSRVRITFLPLLKFYETKVAPTVVERRFHKAWNTNLLNRSKQGGLDGFFFQPQDKKQMVSTFRRMCPGAEEGVVQIADQICRHEFDLLSSGVTALGEELDWHTDFKSGFRWDPDSFFPDIHPAPYPGGYDVKIPWELSRAQHFPWLGQAYWLTGDEKYAIEFRNQVESWISQNPVSFGVNWASTMDVAIRAVNWLWGYAFFCTSHSLDDPFHKTMFRSLYGHGFHIMNNLEWHSLTTNHYLSNLVGLVFLGYCLDDFPEAQSWRSFALSELEIEMQKQVYPDGVSFEASTSYHRLAAELFLSATILAELNGHRFTSAFIERLELMVDVIANITKPDGTTPIIGDQDNGRLQRLKIWSKPEKEWEDFRPLLAVASIWKQNKEWAARAGPHWEDAIWMFGKKARDVHQKLGNQPPAPAPASYRDGGWYVLQHEDLYMFASLGPVGQNGVGGHAHNDYLSFELFSGGQSWIVDPGTYIYTADYEARNEFRSTRSHNTVSISGIEQNELNAKTPFELKERASLVTSKWEVREDAAILHGRLYWPKPEPIFHERKFILDYIARGWLIKDIVGKNKLDATFYLHFAPKLKFKRLTKPYTGLLLQNVSGEELTILSLQSTQIEVEEGWVSAGYGRRVQAAVARIMLPKGGAHQLAVLPAIKGTDPVSRLETMAKKWL